MEYWENEIGDFREITDWEGQAGTGMFPAVLAEGHPALLTAKTLEAAVEKDKVQKELEEAEPALEAAKAAHFSPHDTSPACYGCDQNVYSFWLLSVLFAEPQQESTR